eukprot:2325816-Prymnesium_polylepis.1
MRPAVPRPHLIGEHGATALDGAVQPAAAHCGTQHERRGGGAPDGRRRERHRLPRRRDEPEVRRG